MTKHKYLSWQKYACCNKTFVMTKLCLSWQIFVTTNVLLWQMFCCDHHTFVTTNNLFCHDKHMFVMTSKWPVVSWQTHVCLNKHVFVATKPLSWQKWYLWLLLPMIVFIHIFWLFLCMNQKHHEGFPAKFCAGIPFASSIFFAFNYTCMVDTPCQPALHT